MNNVPQFVNEYFALYFNHISKWVMGKFHFPFAVADDIAAQALVYSISPRLRGESKNPATETDWLRMAKAKARNLALDEIKRQRRSPVVGSIDNLGEDEEGEPRSEHVWVEQASCDRWRANRNERDRRAKGKVAMKLLPQLFALLKTSNRDQRIFRAAVLDAVPTKEVCAAFGVNRQQVYTICCRVAKGLRTYGPKLLGDAYAA